MAEDHLALETANHDAFDDLASFVGLLQGRVALAVAGELELGPDLHTTGRDVEVVEANLRDPRGSAASVGEASASAQDAKLAPVPVGNVEVSMFFDYFGAWQFGARSRLERLDAVGFVDLDFLFNGLLAVPDALTSRFTSSGSSAGSMPISACSSNSAERPRLAQLGAALVLGLAGVNAQAEGCSPTENSTV